MLAALSGTRATARPAHSATAASSVRSTPAEAASLVGGQDVGKAEALRGLRPPEVRAIEGGGDPALLVGALEGIRQRHGGDRRRSPLQGLQDGPDGLGRNERPHRIVDQHVVRGMRDEGQQSGPN